VWARTVDVQAERGAVIALGERLKFFAGTEDWHPVSLRATAGEEEREMRVTLGSQTRLGTVWFDRACVREVERLELWTEPIALAEGERWDAVEIEAAVPEGATLTLEVHGPAGAGEPLLRPAPVTGTLRRSLAGLAALRPDVRAIRLRLEVELGGRADEVVTVRRLAVSRVAH